MIRTLLISGILILTACGGYKTEKDKVYYIEYNEAQGRVKREIGADIMTFKVLDNENYAVDLSQVFYQGNPIDSADPKTFVPLSDYIAKDKNHGFYGSLIVKNSDGKTFELIMDDFTRDKNDVYIGREPLNSTSPETFEVLEIGHGYWSRDRESYYYQHNKVPIKDYESFKILDDDCFFAKDKYQVYKREKVLDEVDAETFVFIERCIGRDKFGCHNGNERCDCPKEKD
jgi:hypothetical protein